MSQIEILLPKMGESVAEATIIKWLKNEGEHVEADEPIVEIATDKVDSEVPAPEAGILLKRLVNDGDVVKVGQPIAQHRHLRGCETYGCGPAIAPAAAPVPQATSAAMAAMGPARLLPQRWLPARPSHEPDPVASSIHPWCGTSPRTRVSPCRNWNRYQAPEKVVG
ncbi:MAG: biotin/lipoyl-containing protein [Flavobacteriales bacterium]